MRSEVDRPKAMLDACVLVETVVSDLILRLAEQDKLLYPHWTDEIWSEVHRAWTTKLRWQPEVASGRREAALGSFPEALVTGYDQLIGRCTNSEKDRHVLAATIHANCSKIITFNLKDFHESSCDSWGIDAEHPNLILVDFLRTQSESVDETIAQMATRAGRSKGELLGRFQWNCRLFAEEASKVLGIPIVPIQPMDWQRVRR